MNGTQVGLGVLCLVASGLALSSVGYSGAATLAWAVPLVAAAVALAAVRRRRSHPA